MGSLKYMKVPVHVDMQEGETFEEACDRSVDECINVFIESGWKFFRTIREGKKRLLKIFVLFGQTIQNICTRAIDRRNKMIRRNYCLAAASVIDVV